MNFLFICKDLVLSGLFFITNGPWEFTRQKLRESMSEYRKYGLLLLVSKKGMFRLGAVIVFACRSQFSWKGIFKVVPRRTASIFLVGLQYVGNMRDKKVNQWFIGANSKVMRANVINKYKMLFKVHFPKVLLMLMMMMMTTMVCLYNA